MTHILFDCPNTEDFVNELSPYLKAGSKVTVVPFSFYDDAVYDAESFNRLFGEGGICYWETVRGLAPFGIDKKDIVFINYFTDTKEEARAKVESADVIYFTGGLPDRMMDRIKEFELENALLSHTGVVMGYSAGAVIQLGEYHLSPDGDYPEFGYYRGLEYLDSFYLEVHYEYKPTQDEAVKRVLGERKKPVYVTHTRLGGIVVDDGNIKTVGKVDVYYP